METFQWIFACVGWALAVYAWKVSLDNSKIVSSLNFELLKSKLEQTAILLNWDSWSEKEKDRLRKLANENMEITKEELTKWNY